MRRSHGQSAGRKHNNGENSSQGCETQWDAELGNPYGGGMQTLEIRALHLRYAPLRIVDPSRVSRLAAALARDGQRTPVLVVGDGVLVDGYHRVEALRQLGRDLVTAASLEAESESEALVLSWRLEAGRRRSALEEGWLVAELLERGGMTQADIAGSLLRPRSWVSQRLGLVRSLPESVQEAVRGGRIPAEAAAKSLLPMARVSREGCIRLVGSLTESVTKRQVEQIYAAWRSADPEGRARIEAHPMLLLRAEAAVEAAPPDAVEQLASDFEAIAGLCRRARQRCRQGVFGQPNSRLLTGTWVQAKEAYQALQEEVGRARS